MSKVPEIWIHRIAVTLLFVLSFILLIFYNGIFPVIFITALFFGGKWLIRYFTHQPLLRFHLLKNLALFLFFLGTGFCFTILRSETNYVYLLNRSTPLMVLEQGSWVELDRASSVETEFLYQGKKASVQTLKIKRRQTGLIGGLINTFKTQRVNVFTFAPDHDFYLIADVEHRMKSLNISEAQRIRSSNFLINASFYDPKNHAVGEVIYQGKKYQNASTSTGYFKVIDGVPHAGPKSVFNDLKGNVNFSCQAHPSTMKDGIIFEYILNQTHHKPSWNVRTYRNLIGETKEGNIVIVASGNGGVLSVKEISQIAQLLGVKDATLFDAGVALQYEFNTDEFKLDFTAFNNSLDLGSGIDRLGMKLFKKNFIQRSPVYIGIKLNK